MKKKFLCLTLVFVISVFLVACDNNPSKGNVQTEVDNSEAEIKAVLKELYDAYYSGDEQPILDFVNDLSFYDMCLKTDENGFLWYSKDNNLDNTTGIAVYSNWLLYIGEWKNNRFDGNGKYYYHGETDCAIVEGSFKKGAPNGLCTERIFVGTEIAPVVDETAKNDLLNETYVGNYVNAVRDGAFEYSQIDYHTDHLNLVAGVEIYKQRRVNEYSGLHYVDGIAQMLSSGKGVAETPWYRPVTKTISPYKVIKPYTGEVEYASGYSAEKTSY